MSAYHVGARAALDTLGMYKTAGRFGNIVTGLVRAFKTGANAPLTRAVSQSEAASVGQVPSAASRAWGALKNKAAPVTDRLQPYVDKIKPYFNWTKDHAAPFVRAIGAGDGVITGIENTGPSPGMSEEQVMARSARSGLESGVAGALLPGIGPRYVVPFFKQLANGPPPDRGTGGALYDLTIKAPGGIDVSR